MKKILLSIALFLVLCACVLATGCASQSDDSGSNAAAHEAADAQPEASAGDASSGTKDDVSGSKEDGDLNYSSDGELESDSAVSADASSGSFVINLDELDLDYTDRDKDASYDESTAVKVSLDGDSASVEGSAEGVVVDGSSVTISQEGVYVLSGKLTDGQVDVECNEDDKAKVQLVLDGVEISNSTGPAIRVNQAKKVFITLPNGAKNVLSDGGDYELDDSGEPYAALYSKDDLTIQGEGSLVVNGNYRHGIAGKDDLVITGGNITVNSKEDALRGNDCVKICGGTLDLTSGEDAIQSSNDESATSGYVLINGGTFKINAGDDGIHAETALIINDGTIRVADSVEGIEGQQIFVNGGDIDVVASDDGLNATAGGGNGQMMPNDGFHGGQAPQQDRDMASDQAFQPDDVPNGQTLQPDDSSGERPLRSDDFPGEHVPQQDQGDWTDGDFSQGGQLDGNLSQDDQLDGSFPQGGQLDDDLLRGDENARPFNHDGSDGPGGEPFEGGQGRGFSGRSPQMDQGDENVILKIAGGKLHVNAGGDGLDSNGSLEVTGGETYVDGPVSGGDGALDYASSATISGGIFVAVGSSGMAESFTSGTQPFAMISANGDAGGVVKVLDSSGKTLAQMTAAKEFSNVAISAPGLEDGSECVVMIDGQETSVVPSTL